MSHFSMIIVTDDYPTHDNLSEILQPWHEFECTGIDDKYVIDVDETDKARSLFENDTKTKLSFRDWVSEYYDSPVVTVDGQLLSGDANALKYGRIVSDSRDITSIASVIKRTNPSAKWDWWTIGGRYACRLVDSDFEECDVSQWKDLNTQEMKRRRVRDRMNIVVDILTKAAFSMEDLDSGLSLRRQFHEEWTFLDEPRPRGADYSTWIKTKSPVAAKLIDADIWDSFEDVKNGQSIADWIKSAPFLSSWGIIIGGKWLEKGQMGWFGMSRDDKDDWDAQLEAALQTIKPKQFIAIVDCHI